MEGFGKAFGYQIGQLLVVLIENFPWIYGCTKCHDNRSKPGYDTSPGQGVKRSGESDRYERHPGATGDDTETRLQRLQIAITCTCTFWKQQQRLLLFENS